VIGGASLSGSRGSASAPRAAGDHCVLETWRKTVIGYQLVLCRYAIRPLLILVAVGFDQLTTRVRPPTPHLTPTARFAEPMAAQGQATVPSDRSVARFWHPPPRPPSRAHNKESYATTTFLHSPPNGKRRPDRRRRRITVTSSSGSAAPMPCGQDRANRSVRHIAHRATQCASTSARRHVGNQRKSPICPPGY